MKIAKKIFIFILLIGLVISNVIVFDLSLALEIKENEKASELVLTKLGIGGGGALFEPAISPHNSNEMLVVPDMGGIYISHDKGGQWNRVNLHGTIISATYDPNREGVVYAGGAGLYRSTDYGKTFELLFPDPNDVIVRQTHNENGLQYFFFKKDSPSSIYDRNLEVKNILIDPTDSNHIFVLCYNYGKGKIFESTNNGESFKELFTYEKPWSTSIQFDFNELIYRSETRDIYAINDKGIIGYNLDTKTRYEQYIPENGLVDVSTVYENGKTYFIIIEKVKDNEKTDTIIYYTNDFKEKIDITDTIMGVKDTTFSLPNYGDVKYKWNFSYVSATSLNNIYVTNWSYATSSTLKEYPYTIDGVIRYHDNTADFLFGNPFRDHNHLASRSWNDGCTYALGVAASKQKDTEFIFTTLLGVNYSEDGDKIYPKHTTVVEGKYPTGSFVTNGIDEPNTYAVYEDPFNRQNLLLLNTDYGLIRSEDNGKSWRLANKGIPNSWANTIYDAKFDKNKEGVVYSVWSGRHNAPMAASNETDGWTRKGGFAISYDGGKTWDAKYSSGLPENTIPVKLGIIYKDEGEKPILIVATFNHGFFISYDAGKTFTEMNDGIEKVSYAEGETYKYILAADLEITDDGRIFAITAKNNFKNEPRQSGELYEYVNNKWEQIKLPKNVNTPRDIYYKDGTLYITGTATAVWDYKNGVDFHNFGGGVYAYKDKEFTQIFDESISTTGVQIDSKGTIFISDINGSIYRKEKDETKYTKILDDYFYISKGIQLVDDKYLYLATFGGGMLKIDGLLKLYKEEKPVEKYYTVQFNSNGGSNIASKKVLENTKVTKPENPTKEGYKFIEWQLNGKTYDFNKLVTEDIELVAVWEKKEIDPIDPEPIEPEPVDPVNPDPSPIEPVNPSPGDKNDKVDYGDIINPDTSADNKIIMILVDTLVIVTGVILLINKAEKTL